MVVIANPRAGKGRVAAALPSIERALRADGRDVQVRLTTRAHDAERYAVEARSQGAEVVVAVGGDGTTSEVANGLLAGGSGARPDLAVVSAGSGSDFIRTFGIPAEYEVACAVARGSASRTLDAIRIAIGGGERYAVNIAEVGFGAANVLRAERLPRWLGTSRYLVAFWLALPGYRVSAARVFVDDRLAYEGRAVNIVVANARFFGGGMKISPHSEPDDGALDVLVFRGPKSDSFTLVSRFYAGSHLPHPNIAEFRGATIRAEADRETPVEADGEYLGTTPVIFSVVPRALTLRV
jgi:diacylglycerol kinase (ATP)